MGREPLPAPGPSFLKPIQLAPGDARAVGIGQPQIMADGWWVALLWCEEAGNLVSFESFSSGAEEPPGSPLQRLGPALSGQLSGFIAAEGSRLQLRLRLGQPPADPARPWQAPLAVLAAFKFEPARVATMRGNDLAQTVLRAFRESLLRIQG